MAQTKGNPARIDWNTDRLVERALELQWERWPDLESSFTGEQLRQTRQDTRFHVESVAAAVWSGELALLNDYVAWVRLLFHNLGLPIDWLIGSLGDIRVAITEQLPAEVSTVAARMIDDALSGSHATDCVPASELRDDRPLSELLARYVGGTLSGDRAGVVRALFDAVDSGASVQDIYEHVLAPAQRELGRLWHLNRISVAQEHYGTAVTQMVMSQLHSRMVIAEPRGRTLIGASVGDERHEVGLRMVVDFLEMEGWETHYLGASVPPAAIVDMTAQRGADVVALSCTMANHLLPTADTIAMLREDARTADVSVIVGGHVFNLVPELWQRVGADTSAPDARAAVDACERLLGP